MNHLGSRDEAEDAVQSTFLNAHRALQRGVTPEAELAWLFKIAHNVCLTRRRSSRRRGRVESPSDLGAVQDVLPAPARESADELIRLTDALSHMPNNQRRAILLREWQGLSYHEIADELKLSQSAVETLIFRARRSLAANLEVEPERVSTLARARKALDIGSLLSAVKTLLTAGAALKATATAVAVSGAAVVATSPPAEHHATPATSAAAPLVAQAPAPATNVAPVQTLDAPTHSAAAPAERVAPVKRERPKAVASEEPAVQNARAATELRNQPAPETPAAAGAPAIEQPVHDNRNDNGNRGKVKEHPPAATAEPAKGKEKDRSKRDPATVSPPQQAKPDHGNGKGKSDNSKGPSVSPPVAEAPVATPTAATPASVAPAEAPASSEGDKGKSDDKGKGHNK